MPVTTTATEYVKVPRGCNPAEIWAAEGAPLSAPLVDALRRRPAASAALAAGVRVTWGAPLLVTRRSFARLAQPPPPSGFSSPHPPASPLIAPRLAAPYGSPV